MNSSCEFKYDCDWDNLGVNFAEGVLSEFVLSTHTDNYGCVVLVYSICIFFDFTQKNLSFFF